MLMCGMKTKSRQSQGVLLKKFMSAQHRNQTEDVKENKLKGRILVEIEMFAMKSCKSHVYSRWNDRQSIVIETEYGYAWMDKADENSQCLETYDAMRKTTESECEAKDQIMVQINKYVRNGGRRYCRILILLFKFGTEMLSVKMHQTEAISWNQTKSGDDAAEKFVSNDAKKATTEDTHLLENVSELSSRSSMIYMRKKVHQVKEEPSQELSEENGKDNDELRNIAAKFYRQEAAVQDYRRTQDFWRQHSSSPEVLWRPRMQRRSRCWRRIKSG